ncbi:methyltransferase domain-containing protein [Mangrovihabitans endophyticus]|uniref:Methyltransferase type 11 n=1 Tax=Mangrovihabitans endophyticus TaxID=1751298 RepID=A0A8J3BVB9_9ACTN|nr:methyltransferase domain-containing protein [Mangrovihabitans endophyticus]GGK80961.1 methyltransferase type 11 [Mangrovihabitans endophyticus]
MDPLPAERTPFADLDRMPPPVTSTLIDGLLGMDQHPEIRRVRAVANDLLGVRRGQRLLDAGSGVGEVARMLGERVGGDGEVVALDYSAATTEVARHRHDGGPVRYLTGDVAALDLPDDHFDGVWCERVLQHLTDPDGAIGEMIRVTRPGGRICLIDTDWRSLAFDGLSAGLSDMMLRRMRDRLTAAQFDMGRTLRGRLVRAGVRDPGATPVTCFFGTPESASVVLPMFNPRVPPTAWTLPERTRDAWFAEVAASGQRGDFLAALTIWVVVGSV